MLSRAELAKRKALWAERKADEAAASDAPWAMGNLRTYQNMASKFWAEHFVAAREDVAMRQQTHKGPWQVYGKRTGKVYAEYPDKGYDNAKLHASSHNRGL